MAPTSKTKLHKRRPAAPSVAAPEARRAHDAPRPLQDRREATTGPHGPRSAQPREATTGPHGPRSAQPRRWSAIGTWLVGFLLTGGVGFTVLAGPDREALAGSLLDRLRLRELVSSAIAWSPWRAASVAQPSIAHESMPGVVAQAVGSSLVTASPPSYNPPAVVSAVDSVAMQSSPTTADAGPPQADAAALVAADAGTKAYEGTWFAALVQQASVYASPEWAKDKRIGYLRSGNRAPVEPNPIRTAHCEAGWYRLVAGGYVCAKYGTLDLDHPKVRLGPAPPNLEDILPYRYAWNTTTGTPLYRSVPSREQMFENEPYLLAYSPRRSPRSAGQELDRVSAGQEERAADFATPLVALPETNTTAERRLWWQQALEGGKPDVKLADLVEDGNAVVARRLVRGFYVAVDRSFPWNNRNWYETPASLVAPADRFTLAKPLPIQGVELAGTVASAAAGFILSTKAKKYQLSGDESQRHAQIDGAIERFTGVRLTGESATVGGVVYRQTTEGWWMKAADGTCTEPGDPPDGLAAGEKWIDVNLSRQTLVAFEGSVPVYASLVSTGRHARNPSDKAHDHRTVQGIFRIREKHLAVTMDGDGPAPGDMPYSIEDVPYVMYFEGSYALHAAFWHSNFGHEQSHGCVNLAPLDAKRLFGWADPLLPQGWHGVFATRDHPGTRVVVHE